MYFAGIHFFKTSSIDISSKRGVYQLVQLSIGQLANFVAELMGMENPAFPLLLRQRAPLRSATALDQRTLSRIDFDAGADAIDVPERWLRREPRPDEAVLRKHLEEHLATLQQRYPDSLRDQVRDIIGQILPSGECRVERVADSLDLHPRVLQKRLQAEGCTYIELLKQTRREIAEQHLRYGSMGITDLALNLGYAEVSVFSRNFKQWTGVSPRTWQQQHGGTGEQRSL